MTKTVLLLLASNVFMTFAWYGHLRWKTAPLALAIGASWGIAFFEYCLQVPANRHGYLSGVSAFQLKLLQEVITLVVFVGFAFFWLKESPKWNHGVAALFLVGAVYFAFLSGDPRAKADAPSSSAAPSSTP